MNNKALIAIGGNSLIRAGEHGTIDEQLGNAYSTAKSLARMAKLGWKLVLTHGNGPQAGAALLRSERAASEVYTHTLDMCVATTQSEIGYILLRALKYELSKAGLDIPVVIFPTMVEVNPDDPAYRNPTKPIGPFYSQEKAEEKKRTLGWQIVEDSARGYRRVVPSPEPLRVFEVDIIEKMIELGYLTIALGGGGIPVIINGDNRISGSEAVIDKDRSSALLALSLNVDLFVISTDADRIYLNFRKRNQIGLNSVKADDLEKHYEDGQFPKGSMGPKVESAIKFVRKSGKKAIITSYEFLIDALSGKAGTTVLP